ncbi:MAG: bifunctional sterol desaturase/short chain dehydrogenase [Elainellaceae cyanobacterium]
MSRALLLQAAIAIGLGLGSVVFVELVRDVYHVVSHYWPPLLKLHKLHHQLYRKDFSIINLETYRKAQIYNDAPEAIAMMAAGGLLWWLAQFYATGWGAMATGLGVLYAFGFFVGAIARAQGWWLESDLTHKPGTLTARPNVWRVNRAYHWRHHFDETTAYYGGHFTVIDKLLGTSLALKNKTVAVTGASGTLGNALIDQLVAQGARPIALTSSEFSHPRAKVVTWAVGQEDALRDCLQHTDILILNHGINVHGDRTPEAVQKSLEVNALSSWRLAEIFFSTVTGQSDRATKELWVNTSEAEVSPALSPLYEISKRLLGDLVTLRRLDAPCIVRKIVLGPFKSQLNPYGIMSAVWVAKMAIALAKRDVRLIIITVNPLTYLLIPLKEIFSVLYFRLFSRPALGTVGAGTVGTGTVGTGTVGAGTVGTGTVGTGAVGTGAAVPKPEARATESAKSRRS